MNTTKDQSLPEIGDARLDEIEASLFAEIGRERDTDRRSGDRAHARAVRRGRIWMGGAAAAAVIAVAAIVGPGLIAPQGGSDAGAGVLPAVSGGSAEFSLDGQVPDGVAESGAVRSDTAGADAASREIVTTASATVQVTDADAAVAAVTAAATGAGGYVEAMSVGSPGMVVDPVAPRIETMPAATTWITVRVPATGLTDLVAGLGDLGEVTSSQIDRRDVTTESVDVHARVTALEASVARLTELMSASSSTADLLAAETALSARQAELESSRQQAAFLDDQVAMSTLSVTLTSPAPTVTADPAGFGDGLAAGWNGLLATLNGLVIGLGFLLPWLGVLAVAGLAVWGIRTLVRRRRGAGSAPRTP